MPSSVVTLLKLASNCSRPWNR